MTQLSDCDKYPSARACESLLAQLPAIGAFRSALRAVTPAEAVPLVGPLSLIARSRDGLRVGAIAEALHVHVSVASRHVAELELRGLVDHAPDPRDGRAVVISATPAGRELLQQARQVFSEYVRTYLPDWTDAEVLALAKALARFSQTVTDAGISESAASVALSLPPRETAATSV